MKTTFIFSRFGDNITGIPANLDKEFRSGIKPPFPFPDMFNNSKIPPPPFISKPPSPPSPPSQKVPEKAPKTKLNDYQRAILTQWLNSHHDNPYPTPAQKDELIRLTGLDRHRVNVWLTNHRIRGNYTSRRLFRPDLSNGSQSIPLQLPIISPSSSEQSETSSNSDNFSHSQTNSVFSFLSSNSSQISQTSQSSQSLQSERQIHFITPPNSGSNSGSNSQQDFQLTRERLPLKKSYESPQQESENSIHNSNNVPFDINQPMQIDRKIPQKPRKTLRFEQKNILLNWLTSHADHPYPSPAERRVLEQKTGLTAMQVRTWFTNNRIRKLKYKKDNNISKQLGQSLEKRVTHLNIPK